MSASFNFTGAIALLRAFVIASLTTQGETPAMIPLATSAEQCVGFLDDAALPLTVFELGNGQSDELSRSYQLGLPITVHHMRQLEAGSGVAIETAMARLQKIASDLAADYRLHSVSVDNTPRIEQVQVGGIMAGRNSEVQEMLGVTGQSSSVCAVSLPLTLTWWEPM